MKLNALNWHVVKHAEERHWAVASTIKKNPVWINGDMVALGASRVPFKQELLIANQVTRFYPIPRLSSPFQRGKRLFISSIVRTNDGKKGKGEDRPGWHS